jgi:predicted DCC family thiol-disulfide oxidoreductase YuxK
MSLPQTIRWLEPLRTILVRAWHTTQKQHLLQYLTVLHALVDTLDKEHLVTHNRPAIPNKLSRRSWRDLNYRVFRVYLKFVVDRQKYLGPPR